MKLDELSDEGLLRLSSFMDQMPFGTSTWWQMVREKRAPQPIKVTSRITAWRVADIRRFLADPQGWEA
jgi:predicted DNA-binding transcriptional regulator AlpA